MFDSGPVDSSKQVSPKFPPFAKNRMVVRELNSMQKAPEKRTVVKLIVKSLRHH